VLSEYEARVVAFPNYELSTMNALGYVVHVKSPGTSGGETRSYQVAQALACAGLDVHLYGRINSSHAWTGQVHPHQLKKPTPIGTAQLLKDFARYHVKYAIERYHFPLFNVGFFAQQIRHNPVIFEVHGFPIDELALLARNHSGSPYLLANVISRTPRVLWTQLQKAVFRRAVHFIVTSEGTKKILIGLGVPHNRISVVYNCVDPALFRMEGFDSTSSRLEFGLPPGGEIILYAGSLAHEELATTIEAAATVISKRPCARFVYVGPGTPDFLQGSAHRLGIPKEHVHVLSPVPHHRMPSLLAAADVVLAPYSLESERFKLSFHYSPLKIMEALAMDKPVVTVSVDELHEVFAGVPNVLFAEDASPSSWAAGILRALDMSGSPTLAQGRAFVLDGHRWADVAEKYIEIIESIEVKTYER
jgi:glycosyltransferase involved in cell wall biosynthesis